MSCVFLVFNTHTQTRTSTRLSSLFLCHLLSLAGLDSRRPSQGTNSIINLPSITLSFSRCSLSSILTPLTNPSCHGCLCQTHFKHWLRRRCRPLVDGLVPQNLWPTREMGGGGLRGGWRARCVFGERAPTPKHPLLHCPTQRALVPTDDRWHIAGKPPRRESDLTPQLRTAGGRGGVETRRRDGERERENYSWAQKGQYKSRWKKSGTEQGSRVEGGMKTTRLQFKKADLWFLNLLRNQRNQSHLNPLSVLIINS